MNKEQILGFDVIRYNEDKLLKNIFEDYQKDEQLFIVNINPEIVVNNYKNNELKQLFNNEKYQIPDGSGIVWASKKQKGNITTRITGIDLMLKICEKSQKYNSKVFFYGAKPEVAQKAKQELTSKHSKLNIIGTCDGFLEENKVIDEIIKANPDILFVGLGSPKQEQFIIKNRDKLKNVKIFMPVGGSFDVIAKTKKRAPKWMINANIEWLYRLFKEPKRIFRQIKLIKYIFLIKRGNKNAKN